MDLKGKTILFFCGGFRYYGAEAASVTLMRVMRDAGAKVVCVASAWTDGVFQNVLRRESIPFHEIKCGWLYFRKLHWTIVTLAYWPMTFVTVARLRREYRPDYIFHVSYRTVATLSWLLGSANILCVQDQLSRDRQARLLLPLLHSKLRGYLACSEFIAADIRRLGVESPKIFTLLNCTSLKVPLTFRNKAGVLQIGIVGQVKPAKGHELLLRALGELSREGKTVRLHVFGGGTPNFVQHLRRLSAEYGLGDCVTFHGFVTEKAAIYPQLDVVVVPTVNEEPFGLAALEPAVYGVPVVASDQGGLPEIVVSGKTGLLFPADDHQALADCLRLLIDNTSMRLAMGSAAQERARTVFSESAMRTRLEAIEWP